MLEEVLNNMKDIFRDRKKRTAAMILVLSVNFLMHCNEAPQMTLLMCIGGIIAVLAFYDKSNGVIYKISSVLYAVCILLSIISLRTLYF